MNEHDGDYALFLTVYNFLKLAIGLNENDMLAVSALVYGKFSCGIIERIEAEMWEGGYFDGLLQETFKNRYKELEFVKNGQKVKGSEIFTRKWNCRLEPYDIGGWYVFPENPEKQMNDEEFIDHDCDGYIVGDYNVWESLEKCLFGDFDVQLA